MPQRRSRSSRVPSFSKVIHRDDDIDVTVFGSRHRPFPLLGGALEHPPRAEREPHIDQIAHLRDVLIRQVGEPS